MTVAELIEKLREMPQHLPVCRPGTEDALDVDVTAVRYTSAYRSWFSEREQDTVRIE